MTTTPKTYKALVAEHIECAATRLGLTRQQTAERLGLPKGNYVSMLVNPDNPTLLSPARIPALTKLCGLSAKDVLVLVHRRIADHPDQPLQLGMDMFKLMLQSTVAVVDGNRKARATRPSGTAGAAGAGHGC